jgi:hypothetical protein
MFILLTMLTCPCWIPLPGPSKPTANGSGYTALNKKSPLLAGIGNIKLGKSLYFMPGFVGYGQFFASSCTTVSQYGTSANSCHSFAKTVFVLSFTVVRLKCPFHDRIALT